MSAAAAFLAREAWGALGGDSGRLGRVRFRGDGNLPSAFPVTDLAAASMAVAALAADELVGAAHAGASPERPREGVTVAVDRRLASFWFASSLRPLGWQVPPLRDPLTGDYRTRDGWIRLHANAPHHRAAARRVLGIVPDRDQARAAIAAWAGADLEQAIIEAGGCAAEMRDADAWRVHPQGGAVRAEPLVLRDEQPSGPAPGWRLAIERPLQGVRILDLTRVLAGPVATRFLAGLGATVLRIDPPDWDEPGAVPDMTRGKRCARLDLKTPDGRSRFAELLAEADLLVHGLRPGALDALGFGPVERLRLAPGLVDVSLDAYGWHGPWATRRGFDSLVQMSCGIADAGMRHKAVDAPVPLPVQALDHATGYLMAAAALRGLTRRLTHGVATRARLSLARTAAMLMECAADFGGAPHRPEQDADHCTAIEATPWGPAHRIRTPWSIAAVDVRWELPAAALGSSAPQWPG